MSLSAPGPARAEGAGGAAGAEGLDCQRLVEALATEGRVALQGVVFDFNQATLRADSQPALVAARDAIVTLGGSWRIEGHTDDRGDHAYNLRLSQARAQAVRDWLVGAGAPGDALAAQGFSYDRPVADNASDAGRARNRRVELVGEVTPDMLGFGGPEGVDPCPSSLPEAADLPPWQASGGQEWLPFSYLMATAQGGGEGWQGARHDMPPGAQPRACQALCQAEAQCAAFSFEPAGSFFVENARCALIGYGSEMRLERSNGYHADGAYFASGLKPDARLLTPESEAVAAGIIADLAEIEALRARLRLTAPETFAAGAPMPVALEGAVPPDQYGSFVEIADLGDYAYDWRASHTHVVVADMEDGARADLVTPGPGDYTLRYVIDHPTAGYQTIAEQPLSLRAPSSELAADGTAAGDVAAGGTVEPDTDRPGADLAQLALSGDDPLACQALCAADPACRAWTFVRAGLQGDEAMCWTKSEVPDAYPNPCCVSGVIGAAAGNQMPGEQVPGEQVPGNQMREDRASLDFPMAVGPGEALSVSYHGPLYPGDWIDIIVPGHDDDMSGALGWAWAEGAPVILTTPPEGEYQIRYVAEMPDRGRVVLASEPLVVQARFAAPGGDGDARQAAPVLADAADLVHRCPPQAMGMIPCEIRDPEADLIFSLMQGYATTAPLHYRTAGGAEADRPGFDLVRLSDLVVIASVNPRQAAADLCLPGGQDRVCLLMGGDAPLSEADQLASFALAGSLGSLASVDAAGAAAESGPQDQAAVLPGDLQGVWVLSREADERAVMVVELIHDAGAANADGTFLTAPHFTPMPQAAGDAGAALAGDDLRLTLRAPDGALLHFAGQAYGSGAFRGMIGPDGGPEPEGAGAAILRQMAGPGEDWRGEPWMHGEADGMAAAMQMGAALMGDMLTESTPEDRAMLEMLGAVMGGVGQVVAPPGADIGADPSALLGQLFGAAAPAGEAPPPSAQMQALEGVPLGDLSADEAMTLFLPHLEVDR